MKHRPQWVWRTALLGLSVVSWAGTGSPSAAQVLAPAPEQPAKARQGALSNPILQREVSLEAMSKPLPDVIGELAVQGAVALKIDPTQVARLPQGCCVTMRVRALSLAKVLASLANLYGGEWRADEGASFTWMPLETPLVLQARRLVGSEGEIDEDEHKARRQRDADLAGQIYNSVDEARWRSPEGVPLPEVSPELWAPLIQRVQNAMAPDVARAYNFYQDLLVVGPTLRLGKSAPETLRLWTAIDTHSFEFGIRLMVGDRVVFPQPLFGAPASGEPGAARVDDGRDDEYLNRKQQKADRLRERLRNPNAP